MSKASDRAYEMLRSMIISGALAPGAQLKEEQVAELCGVSRTPVRHAIHRLEAEMFVERTESQRSFVSQWSNEDVSDLFALRALLESYAAERAAVNMSDAILAQLSACCDRIDQAIHATPPHIDAFLAENAIFHGLILEAAGSDRLSAMLRRIVLVPLVLRTALQYDQPQLERSHSEHQEIVAAFTARDAQWASAVMTGHIRRAAHVYQTAHGQAPQARQQD